MKKLLTITLAVLVVAGCAKAAPFEKVGKGVEMAGPGGGGGGGNKNLPTW